MDLKEIDQLGDSIASHWYYQSKARAMTRLLGHSRFDTVLDVGAGSGFFSRHLLAHSTAREAWCVDISYPEEVDQTAHGKSIHLRRAINAVHADLVLMMDVLEHVDDDAALLGDYVSKVPSGSLFLITVPAFDFLWSAHDDFLEHKRRYTLNQLEAVVRQAGLSVKQGNYCFSTVFPIAATLRLAGRLRAGGRTEPPRSQLKAHHPVVNRILESLCSIERPFMPWNRLAGLTAMCLAVKQ